MEDWDWGFVFTYSRAQDAWLDTPWDNSEFAGFGRSLAFSNDGILFVGAIYNGK